MKSVGVLLVVVGALWVGGAAALTAVAAPWALAASQSEVFTYALGGLLFGALRLGWPGLIAVAVGVLILLRVTEIAG